MPRPKKKELIDNTPEKLLNRGDVVQYWLQQRALPDPGSDTYKSRLTVFDKMVIGMINKAEGGNAPAFNAILDAGFGKSTEGADVSISGDSGISLDWNAPDFKGEDEVEREDG